MGTLARLAIDRLSRHAGSVGLSVSGMDEHGTVLNLDLKHRLTNARIQAVLAASHIKLPAMPRTSHDTASQLSFGQRSSLMSTNPVDGLKLSVDVEQRDNPPLDHSFFRRPRRQLRHVRDFVPIQHGHDS